MKVKAKKHLGQHFLNDLNIAKNIADGLTWENYEQVLEIGPGMGVLTQFVLKQNKKISVVEIDEESVEYLKVNFQLKYPNLDIYSEDFLKMNLVEKFPEPIAILGNFPYNISSQIVFHVIDFRNHVPELVGMFQKEVAERIASPKGNKDYGILSVIAQAYYKIEYLFTVPENVFTPPPKVKSGVIRMIRYRNELPMDEKKFIQVVKLGFNQRRKTLRNALRGLAEFEKIANDQRLSLRAEQLDVDDFIDLTKILIS